VDLCMVDVAWQGVGYGNAGTRCGCGSFLILEGYVPVPLVLFCDVCFCGFLDLLSMDFKVRRRLTREQKNATPEYREVKVQFLVYSKAGVLEGGVWENSIWWRDRS
jgi:hypothetical protein